MATETTLHATLAPSRVRRDLIELLKLAWPVVLARLGIMAMGLTDQVVVGHQSARQLGFHALGWMPTSIVLSSAIGLLLGVGVMTARHIGEGRRGAAGGVLRRGLIYGAALGGISVAILVIAGPPFLHRIGLAPDLADGAMTMLVFAWSLPFYFVATIGDLFPSRRCMSPNPA